MSSLAQQRDKRNYALHLLYTRQEFEECLKQIDKILEETDGLCEYAIYIKALIMRHRGKIQESLQLFQQATAINPHNVANLKQVGRSLYLLGKHKAAVDVYEEAAKFGAPDWEIMHNKGLCYMYLKQYDRAIESFRIAIDIQPHDSTFLQLGKVYSMMDDYAQAINVYMEALEHSPENPEILTTLGLLFLRTNDNNRAFDYLSTSLTHEPRNPRTILAAGSIIQDHSDMDVALVKYRVAAVQTPNSPQLWNNIGMCFFGKQRYIAAIACLKKALYLGPFEWIISYNLGLVHLHTGQYASAFHYFSASVNLKPDFAHSYMYLAVTLARLDDVENACAAYEKAIQMAGLPGEPVFHLNYAILLYNQKQYDSAKAHLIQFRALFSEMDEEARRADPDVTEQSGLLGQLLNM
ncbi:Bardet-Biedl syndrome 4 protein [Pleodorina starrii]|uniref:Bardet-Biedl syndrome 4 protein n=1 Tax=Pleodorina starrii TaxID=330485 RepID=A0A9W6F608_9CHLO|nr:Bardet-Biedl syndrome 4 protein [Pleodorina starrii]GLC56986.1 Bardet-Biedl syndrome 4 protein [Pleodorina starrii]GLC64820.1 Bardet-Biedl syndrome 4 protein [Pleodorina starrii]